MAIRNLKLGGTNWLAGNFVPSADLNDTFDEIYNISIGFKS